MAYFDFVIFVVCLFVQFIPTDECAYRFFTRPETIQWATSPVRKDGVRCRALKKFFCL